MKKTYRRVPSSDYSNRKYQSSRQHSPTSSKYINMSSYQVPYFPTHRLTNKSHTNSTINQFSYQPRVTSSMNSSKRNKIFVNMPVKIQHFQIGVRMDNLHFQQLDQTFVPSIFESTSCGCENTLQPCARIMSQLSSQKIITMRQKYQELKQSMDFSLPYSKIKNFMKLLPSNYPEALFSHLQNLLRILSLDKSTFVVLAYIVWHCKVEYLSYWIYTEIIRLTNETSLFFNQIKQLINSYSKDLRNLLKNEVNFGQFCNMFFECNGTNLIPLNEYGRYIELLNKEGKFYPPKVLFIFLLYHKQQIQAKNLRLLQNEQNFIKGSPWNKIFLAAKNQKLK